MDLLLHDVSGPLIGMAISALSGAAVWILTRRTHTEKDELHEQTLELLRQGNGELRLQNATQQTRIDDSSARLAKLETDLAVMTEMVTNKAAIAEMARELAELRADTAKWQANEETSRESGRRLSADEHGRIVQSLNQLHMTVDGVSKQVVRLHVASK